MSKSLLVFVGLGVAIASLLILPRVLRSRDTAVKSNSVEVSATPEVVSPPRDNRPAAGSAPSSSPASAKQDITRVFEIYRTALLQSDGHSAWAVLDSHTTQFFSQVHRDALSLPKAEFARLDFMRKLMVLRLRHEMRRPLLQAMNGQDVFVMGVTNGWIGRSTVESIEKLHAIQVEGRYARATLPQAPTTPAFFFIQEGAEWKFALWKSFELANSEMQKVRQQSGLPEHEFFVRLLGQVSKLTVDQRIFDGPID